MHEINFKSIKHPRCPNCNKLDVKMINVIKPGNSLLFYCKNCNEEFIEDYDFKIKIDEEDLWYSKYVNEKSNTKYNKNDIDNFIARPLDNKEWNYLKIMMSHCERCESSNILIELLIENELKLMKLDCLDCSFQKHIFLNL